MKRFAVMFLLILILFFSFGCSANVESGTGEYLNVATKNPTATHGDQNGGDFENNSPDESVTPDKSDLAEDSTDSPLNTAKPNNNPEETSESTVEPTLSGATSSPTIGVDIPATNSGSVSTTKPTITNKPTSSPAVSSTDFPDITPTLAPVITQGPEDYFILTIDNGGGGGYVYINQGQDGPTNINKGWFDAGSYVSISAVPYDGCTFDGWYVGEDFVSPYTDYNFYMPARDYPLTARFVF